MIITGGKIITCAGQTLEDGYIRIAGGKIAEVAPGKPPVAGRPTLDAGGCLVLPGFVDAHTHLGMWEDGLGFEGDDGNEDTDPCTPHLRAVDAINPLERSFSEALRAGVTTVVTGPGSSNPIGGQLAAIKTYGNRVDEMLLGTVGIKFALGENPKVSFHAKNQAPVTRMAIAALIREQLYKARRYSEALEQSQQDEDREPPEYDAKCEALLPLLSGKLQAHFHAHRADDIFTAIRLAEEFGLKLVLVHCTEGHLVAKQLAELGCSVICGPMLCSRSKPELRNAWAGTPAALLQAGVTTAISSDHPELPIAYLALGAGVAGAEGIGWQELLHSLTIYPAKICGLEKRVGSIEPGKDADLLIYDSDPFTVGAKPKMVIAGGKLVQNQAKE